MASVLRPSRRATINVGGDTARAGANPHARPRGVSRRLSSRHANAATPPASATVPARLAGTQTRCSRARYPAADLMRTTAHP
jgi:hypothetical protein